MKKKALGRGLDSLIPADDSSSERITEIEVGRITPNRYQMRTRFEDDKIEGLAETIKENGIFQPVIVTKSDNGGYMLIAGERRLRAAKKAGLKKIPCIERELGDENILVLSLVENIQRENLSPVEEATAYKRMKEEFSMTQAEIAEKVGRSRSSIANTLRILTLPENLIEMVSSGALSAGHARALLSIDYPKNRLSLAHRIIREKLTVREAEKLAAGLGNKIKKLNKKSPSSSNAVINYEDSLEKALGTKVKIKLKGETKTAGRIEIEFYSLDDFERIFELISGEKP